MSKKVARPKRSSLQRSRRKKRRRKKLSLRKPRNLRGEKKKKKEKGVHVMYKVEGDKVTRLRPTCERCGPGYFMGDHKDRYTCGHCGFTRYKTQSETISSFKFLIC